MKRLLFTILILLSILVIAERILQNRRRAERLLASTFRTLVHPQAVSADRVQRIQIRIPEAGRAWEYRYLGGAWRYPEDFDAYARGDRITRMLDGVLQGPGTTVSADPRSDSHYGLAPEQAMVVRLADASGEPLQEVWIGRSVPGKNNEESYAKIAGSDTIYHLHANPRLVLGWTPGSGGPPLIDPYVLPRALARKTIVKVSYRAGRPYPLRTLSREEIAPARPTLPGRPPEGPTFAWRALFEDGEKTCNTAGAFAYVSFLSRLRYEKLHDPQAGPYGFGDAGNRLSLEDEDGTVDTLEVGGRDAAGNTYLRHRTTGQILSIAPRKAALLFPSAPALLDSLPPESPYRQAEPTAPFSFQWSGPGG